MRKFIATATAGLLLLAAMPAAAQFEEGRHFQRIGTPIAVEEDRVEVVEAFAYPCPACRRFLPHIAAWEAELPEQVEFSRLPVGLQPGWGEFARGFYTAQVTGIYDAEVHEAMFRAVHDERRGIRSFDDIAAFYADHGISREEFINTSESFAVDSRMRQNRNDVRKYGVRSTPNVIVQGKWLVTPSGLESYEQMIAIIDFLVEREIEELGLDEEAAAGDDAEASG